MAALPATNPTLLDLAKMLDPQNNIAEIAEILNQQNDILDDMTWQEGNLITGHRGVIRTGIPAPTWRKLYGGVQPGKGTTAVITDNCGQLAAYIEADKELADLSGNVGAFMLSHARAYMEGFNQTITNALFFANEGTAPETFTGLAPRFNSTTAPNGENIILGGSVDTDNASIWLVYWSPSTVFGIVPRGSAAGLQMEDKGQVTLEDASGGSNTGRMEAYRSYMTWKAGLHVADWRAVVRIANIDKSTLTADGASGAKLPDLMFQALETVPRAAAVGRPAFYASRAVLTKIRQQLSARTSESTLAIEDVGGRKVMTFQGVPLRRCDALAADESLVT